MTYSTVPTSVQQFMDDMTKRAEAENPRWAEIFNKCFANTLLTTVKRFDDGSTFLLTGDIPAMWLRDSTAQVRPYLAIAKEDDDLQAMIAGLVKRQFRYINLDPYANAFNEEANNAGHQTDHTEMNPWIWERKYEIDSLCYPIQLAYLLYKETGRRDQFDASFESGITEILKVWETEQNHDQSPYTFERDTTRVEDTLTHDGRGTPVGPTGMTWSGFRPSDDVCKYGYLVPSNMFAVVVLSYLEEIYTDLLPQPDVVARVTKLKNEIDAGIKEYAQVANAAGETVFAFEVDGLGNHSIHDDSNVPSLMAAPYLGYCAQDDPIYLATRKTLLSSENPYYYEGKNAKGIGSSHTPENYIWPIALAIEGLTTSDKADKKRILDMLVDNDGGTNLMHEGFDVNDANNYTREWFSWANMMFCELLMDYYDIKITA
ncbi:glycoside hydrolase family 125 protein [Brochothrix thermosphacta]|uniref:Metal-independent alpha-mannosidase n=1 Tax=Brochothrix thermosphacta TaxID=2756 RepID=A0A1D2LYN9_BROTH|nr:glycoside hydrolase family 125 protein [Brochothrix thermosphacta]ATF24940.1 metal-independent alpha-mannosidase [Brochothrix thermosphacta]ATH84355.1 metal-independent alpha-mannosidase [Brochothrix thermosphacta]MPQ28353.1 glycoside hydrolase family 125 protein [Brochothrix thermosphacta]ODJ61291.1 metal-independent alpha-mannosidase [Brochothrix thermosphacta]ODJ70351.1 metal-independent alpha-mannosidase [Brochothrix thermosphacta]